MELFQLLQGIGINPAAVAGGGGIVTAVIFISSIIKNLLPTNFPDRFVLLIPAVVGSIITFPFAQPLTLVSYWQTWLLSVPFATFVFKFGKTVVLGK